ncbi:MAG: hypothetical protein H6R48_441 [Proteobacteria bacterium]|nr:hypothetical protein [Pseudomonadota bacterium]
MKIKFHEIALPISINRQRNDDKILENFHFNQKQGFFSGNTWVNW